MRGLPPVCTSAAFLLVPESSRKDPSGLIQIFNQVPSDPSLSTGRVEQGADDLGSIPAADWVCEGALVCWVLGPHFPSAKGSGKTHPPLQCIVRSLQDKTM